MEELLLDVRQNTLFRARPATLACGGINYLGAKAVTKGIPKAGGLPISTEVSPGFQPLYFASTTLKARPEPPRSGNS